MKKFLYHYYLKIKRQNYINRQKKSGTSIATNTSGYMNVIFEGENAVPEGCTFSGKIFLGHRTTLGKNNLLSGNIHIGKYCQLGMNVALHGTNHPISFLSTYINSRLFDGLSELKSEKHISIGNDVWIGHAAIILGGINIGNGSIIAAGSVVTKDVEPYSIVAGNPAKIIRKRFSENIISEIEQLKWWDKSDEELIKIKPLFFKDFSKIKSIYE
ncbi:CatB-related O-acetyltransferase [Flavobacterium ardleyense]|uniref:CatB-related O-acetyltransferase n=1 Tax=Flavobacterium ardleyense TaxID=2038737 RepID=UPI00298C8BC5|nr:CatB-related O-acetyltransferase [Flavobacterium ardleyense]